MENGKWQMDGSTAGPFQKAGAVNPSGVLQTLSEMSFGGVRNPSVEWQEGVRTKG